LNIDFENILFVGGAVSIDRNYNKMYGGKYWEDEVVKFDFDFVKDLKDIQLLLKAAIAGVSANLIASAALAFKTADALNKVAAANLKAFGVQDLTADQAATRGFANSRAVDFRL
jgi:hypothetical protein